MVVDACVVTRDTAADNCIHAGMATIIVTRLSGCIWSETRHSKRHMEQWIWFILIGLAAGFLAGAVVKGHGFGILGNIIVGIIGAVLGGFIFSLLGVAATNTLGKLISAFVGAVVLLMAIGFVKRKGA
jgi:uncharacterized membrane protein YeaQ/YmgE (transglycosylase-associated protein family)